MNSECTDPELGKLLHAYELGLLNEKELHDFEIHMLRCQCCFSRAAKFAPCGEMLRYDKGVIKATKNAVKSKPDRKLKPGRMWNYLWPDLPLPLKPAILVALVIILLYPAYRGLLRPAADDIRNVSHINLYSSRSSARDTFHIDGTREILLSFVYRDAIGGHKYEITLFNNADEIIYHSRDFDEFDKYETGRLLLPADILKPGLYRLEIIDPENNRADSKMVYLFNVGTD